MTKTKHDPTAVDEYLAELPDDRRAVLRALRQLIRSTVPDIQERISYGTTVVFARNRDLVGFVAQPKHLSFFTMSPELAQTMKADISRTHKVSGTTIHFTPDNPLPPALVEKILVARVEEQR